MSRVLFLAIVAAAVLIGVRSGTGVFDGVQDALRGQADAITRTVPVEGGSLLRADALKAALAGLPAGDVVYLRVSRDRIDAQVVVGERLHNVRVTAAGRVFDIPTPDARPRRRPAGELEGARADRADRCPPGGPEALERVLPDAPGPRRAVRVAALLRRRPALLRPTRAVARSAASADSASRR